MAQTTNMEILSFLLQDIAILEYTPQDEQDRINALPPLNHYTTEDEPRIFLYDGTEEIIGYLSPEQTKDPEYQEILSQKPICDALNIQVYEAQLSVIPLD